MMSIYQTFLFGTPTQRYPYFITIIITIVIVISTHAACSRTLMQHPESDGEMCDCIALHASMTTTRLTAFIKSFTRRW